MNRGLLLKSLRELAPATLILGGALLIVQAVLQFVLPRALREVGGAIFNLPIAQSMIRAMLGTDTVPELGPQLFTSIPWVHPVVLALFWAHAIIGATRLPAGEVDRGTIDILCGLPASRRALFLADSLAWACAGLLVLALAITGNALGGLTNTPEQRAAPGHVLIVAVNLLALYLAVGGVAYLASAVCDRRGRAMAAAFLVVVAMFLLNYLAQLWRPTAPLGALSLLHYYRPMFTLRDGAWPMRDLAVLAGVSAAAWIAAGAIFARRDLSPT